MRSEISSLHLTHPSAHMPGAVGSRHCSARGAVGGSVPCLRVSPQSWTLPAIRTHNIGLPWDSSPIASIRPRISLSDVLFFSVLSHNLFYQKSMFMPESKIYLGIITSRYHDKYHDLQNVDSVKQINT